MEEWTSTDIIKDHCENFRKLDSGNFAKAIGDTSDSLLFKGIGRNRSVKVSKPGWEEVTRLINKLTGE